MRFLHTADWHLGKKLHGFDLLAEQREICEQILKITLENNLDTIVIAGDLYDRSVPGEDAIALLNEVLMEYNLQNHIRILAISGNHDSAVRLGQGSQWFTATDYYLNTQLNQSFKPVLIDDTQFFLLPYFEPFQAREYFDDPDLHNIASAMKPVIDKMQAQFLPDKKHVLVAHFFAAGSTHVDSETTISVGGLDAVPTDMLEIFDYVALGHLHGKDALKHDTIRYSGSPLKFSASEANQQKGVFIVDTDPFSKTFVPLEPSRDLRRLSGAFSELIDPEFYGTQNRDDYLAIELTDSAIIPNAMTRLREVYPNIISLERVNNVDLESDVVLNSKHIDPVELFETYFNDATGKPLDKQQLEWAKDTLNQIKEDGI